MTEKNRTILKSVINYTASIVTALLCFLLCVAIAFGVLTSKWYIKSTVKSSKYISGAATELKEDMISLAIPSGLPENFFNDKISTDLLLDLNNQIINNAYGSANFKTDITAVKAYHIALFKEYASSAELDNELEVSEEGLNYLSDLCAEKYKKMGANSVFKYLSLYAGKLNAYMPFAIIGLIAVNAFCFMFLIKLGKAERDKRFIYFSLCGAGIMTLALPLFVILGGYVKKISISSRAMHQFIMSYVNNILTLLVILGVILIALSIFILFFKKKDKKTEKTLDLN